MGVVMVTSLFYNFAVCRDAARRTGSSVTAELLVAIPSAKVDKMLPSHTWEEE